MANSNRPREAMDSSNPVDMVNRRMTSIRWKLNSMAAQPCKREAMEAVALAGVDNAEALAHAMVALADLASAHRAEASDPRVAAMAAVPAMADPHVAAMAVAQVSMMSMVAPAMVAPRVAMAVLPPEAAPAVTEDGEQTNKMKKRTDKIVNAINKMV